MQRSKEPAEEEAPSNYSTAVYYTSCPTHPEFGPFAKSLRKSRKMGDAPGQQRFAF
jgi:hypothetical protein